MSLFFSALHTAIAQCFLGRRVNRLFFELRVAEQGIAGGDDVLDLTAGLCLKQRNGVDQHRLIGSQVACRLQLRQGYPALNAGLEEALVVKIRGRGQGRKGMEGASRVELHAGTGMSSEESFIDMF